ncbi:uncharacterized protein LOC113336743 [Papaver somniferum]|uniref:uncharacterized protein LOC113336743 n=1 Tax=Papaver somniferum TaxID=3469 RepID=UPI000E6F9A0A|nr:uncharacterized protein LOC113336743 [Papaver somniferum]
MEGVGARLGRSSTRYGPATVFSGPVRKWKKNWVHVSPSNSSNHHAQSNGSNGNNNGSHLLLYKWTSDKSSSGKDYNNGVTTPEETPPKKIRYIPISVLEEQRREAAEEAEDEAKLKEAEATARGASKSDGSEGKPDINDIPEEETQDMDEDEPALPESNETSLDLNLGLKALDGERAPSSKTEGQLERANSGGTSR